MDYKAPAGMSRRGSFQRLGLEVFPDAALGNTLYNGRPTAVTYDVCYCDADCHTPSHWFKVGQAPSRASPSRAEQSTGASKSNSSRVPLSSRAPLGNNLHGAAPR